MGFDKEQVYVDEAGSEINNEYFSDGKLFGKDVSIEVKKTGWVFPLLFPYSTVDIPFRKSTQHPRYDRMKNDKFRYFILFHRSLESFIVVRREDFDNSPHGPKPNIKMPSGDEDFVKVPVDKVFFIAKIKGAWYIKRSHTQWQILSSKELAAK
jgi:hypothetical protein